MSDSKSNNSPARYVGRMAKAGKDCERSAEKIVSIFSKALPKALGEIAKQLIRPTAGQLDAAAKVIEAYAAVYSQMAKAGEDALELLGEFKETVRKHRDEQGAYTIESFEKKDVEKAAKTTYANA